MINSFRTKKHNNIHIKAVAILIAIIFLFENEGYSYQNSLEDKPALRPMLIFSNMGKSEQKSAAVKDVGWYVSEGRKVLANRNFDEARNLFGLAANNFIDLLEKLYSDRYLSSLSRWEIEHWARETGTSDVFEWDRVKDLEFKIRTRQDLKRFLVDSLLLANDYFRLKGPDISQASPITYGVIERIESLHEEDFERIGRVEYESGEASSSSTFEFLHSPSNEAYIVKFLDDRNMTELLGQLWYKRLGFSTIDTRVVSFGGIPAIIMKKIDQVETLYDYIFRQLFSPFLFKDSIIIERILPDSYRKIIESSKLADVVIELKDAHLRNILLRVDDGGKLLPEQPIFIDKERSFGFRTNPHTGEGLIYQPYRGGFGKAVLESGRDTHQLYGGEPLFHRGVPIEHLRLIAASIADIKEDDVRRIISDALQMAGQYMRQAPDFSQEILLPKWMQAIDSVRIIFGINLNDGEVLSDSAEDIVGNIIYARDEKELKRLILYAIAKSLRNKELSNQIISLLSRIIQDGFMFDSELVKDPVVIVRLLGRIIAERLLQIEDKTVLDIVQYARDYVTEWDNRSRRSIYYTSQSRVQIQDEFTSKGIVDSVVNTMDDASVIKDALDSLRKLSESGAPESAQQFVLRHRYFVWDLGYWRADIKDPIKDEANYVISLIDEAVFQRQDAIHRLQYLPDDALSSLSLETDDIFLEISTLGPNTVVAGDTVMSATGYNPIELNHLLALDLFLCHFNTGIFYNLKTRGMDVRMSLAQNPGNIIERTESMSAGRTELDRAKVVTFTNKFPSGSFSKMLWLDVLDLERIDEDIVAKIVGALQDKGRIHVKPKGIDLRFDEYAKAQVLELFQEAVIESNKHFKIVYTQGKDGEMHDTTDIGGIVLEIEKARYQHIWVTTTIDPELVKVMVGAGSQPVNIEMAVVLREDSGEKHYGFNVEWLMSLIDDGLLEEIYVKSIEDKVVLQSILNNLVTITISEKLVEEIKIKEKQELYQHLDVYSRQTERVLQPVMINVFGSPSAVFECISSNNVPITRKDIGSLLNRSERTIQPDIHFLIKAGLITKRGNGATSLYEVNSELLRHPDLIESIKILLNEEFKYGSVIRNMRDKGEKERIMQNIRQQL